MNTKICTSIEESKKLLGLGLDRNTSDMYYWCGSDLRIGGYRAQDEADIPAWSLSALLELMPIQLKYKKGIVFPVLNLWENSMEYSNFAQELMYVTLSYEYALDAAFEMVCYLLEKKYI